MKQGDAKSAKREKKLKLKKKAVCLQDRVEKITLLGGKIQEEPVSNNSENLNHSLNTLQNWASGKLTQMSHFLLI